MKKYGMADVMMAVVKTYFANHMHEMEKEKREEIEKKCCTEILMKYPAARDREVET